MCASLLRNKQVVNRLADWRHRVIKCKAICTLRPYVSPAHDVWDQTELNLLGICMHYIFIPQCFRLACLFIVYELHPTTSDSCLVMLWPLLRVGFLLGMPCFDRTRTGLECEICKPFSQGCQRINRCWRDYGLETTKEKEEGKL